MTLSDTEKERGPRAAGVRTITLSIPAKDADRTIASALRDEARISWSTAKALIAQGRVKVNGETAASPSLRLKTGDTIEARFDPEARYRGRKPAAKIDGFRVVLEDRHLIAVDKDAGLLTVPAPSGPDDTLAQRLLADYRRRGIRQQRLWIVHRIDRFTSGLVLFGRTQPAAEHLVDQFASRTPRREYLALCEGTPHPKSRRLVSRLQTDTGGKRVRLAAKGTPARQAICHYDVVETLRGAALVRVRLETGRRNQIRVQMAEIGHPILGDRVYGNPGDLIDRPALHAALLEFVHPADRHAVILEAPPPADFEKALAALRRR